jgi:REP element-mobilizing transposase RayT
MSDLINLTERRNLRLEGYDYSKSGMYFVTVCVHNRACLFGRIENKQIILNDAGRMIEKWFHELEHKYPDKKIHEFVVMPNHFHGIVENRYSPESKIDPDAHAGAPLRGRPEENAANKNEYPQYDEENRVYGATIGRAINWFKTMTTNAYIRGVKNMDWAKYDGKLWQRNYHDHIIRTKQEYYRISEYIRTNPEHWEEDCLR